MIRYNNKPPIFKGLFLLFDKLFSLVNFYKLLLTLFNYRCFPLCYQ